jgi:hypothetical protein
MQLLIPQSQVSGDLSKAKGRANRRIKAKVKVRARVKASLRTKTSPTSHLPHGKAAARVRVKSPSKDR